MRSWSNCTGARRRVFSALAGCVLFCTAACSAEAKTPHGPPPKPSVVVAPVEARNVELYTQAVGQLEGYVDAQIRARVSGFLHAQAYRDGTSVKAGQLLFTIDATEYQAALEQARGAAARAQAAVQLADAQLKRTEQLLKTGTVAQRAFDDARAASDDAQGQARVAQASVHQAEINLSYTQLRSPIDGLSGLALVRVGNLVGKDGPTLLTTVSQVDYMRMRFPIGERDYLKNAQRYRDLSARDLKWARVQFAELAKSGQTQEGDPGIELVLADDSSYPLRGLIVSTDREINPSTGTITVEALFPNPDGLLRPGQYGRVKLLDRASNKSSLVVAQRALIEVQGTFSLAVVGSDNKVELRRVEVGPTVGDARVIESGVKAAERVVVDGVQKVSDGAEVIPKLAEPEPKPEAKSALAR